MQPCLLLRRTTLSVLLLVLAGDPTAGQDPPAHDETDRAPFLTTYAGRYQLTERFFLDVTRVGDALYVQATGQPPAQLRPRSRTEFVIVGSSLRLLFEVDAVTGEVDHLVFEQNGFGRRAERVPPVAVRAAPPTVDLSTAVLERYVGTYEEQPGFALAVSLDAGVLRAGLVGLPPERFEARTETAFVAAGSGTRLSFVLDGDARPTAVILHQGGDAVEMARVSD